MNWEAFKNDWVNGKLTKGKVNSWKIPLEPNRGGNARYWISCKATQGKTTVYSNTQEYIMQDYLSGTDWAKTRCDFPVSGKTDKFFFTAAAKVLKAEDAAYVGILPMDPELGANEKKEKARAKGGPAVNAIQQPYSAQFGSASIWNAATVSKKMSVNSDGTFLLVRRGWANPLSGCNLPGAMGNAKYQLKKGERMRWVPDHFTTAVFVDGLKAALFPMNKKAPVKGAKNIYNTNIKVGTALVLNSKGQGVLLDDNGAVQKKFTNGGKYLRRIFRHHSLEGEEGEQRFIHRNH
jgi:hypothetical protein